MRWVEMKTNEEKKYSGQLEKDLQQQGDVLSWTTHSVPQLKKIQGPHF